jgi:thimet oligopeptidase
MRWMLLASLMSLLLYAKPAADPSSSPSFDCQSELAGLKALPTLPQEPNAWLEAVDAWRLPARNRLLEAYVYNDAAEDPASRKAACRCIIDLSKAFEKHTKALRLEARKLLPKAQGLEARALKAWAGSDKALKSPEYRAVNDKARSLSQRFRGNIDKFEGSYAVPAQCRDGLPKKWQKAIPLRGGAVLAALKDVKPRCQQDLFVAYVSRLKASNQSVLTDLLAVRQQQAELDGYKNYADQRLAKTQLGDGEAVWRYLDKLSKSNKAASDVERQRRGDKPFWQLSQDTAKEEPQDYQPKQVIDGYFAWLGQQLGVTFKPSRPAFHWAEDISAYSLEKDGKALGILYLDLYPRDGKYCHNRHREFKRGVDGVQLPASVLVMNLPRDKWQHKHLKSLMHESGHALNNLLASQPYEILSGIRLPLDLVEVPAKVLERLAWDPKVHKAITGIARTPAPDNRQSGIALDERILKSAMALAYHQSGKPDMEAINAELYQKYLHQAYIPGLSPQYAFRHLASYGPAYFTYLYSDAEAADISDAIQQGQLSLAQFADCMLKPGGSIPARDQLACATTVD